MHFNGGNDHVILFKSVHVWTGETFSDFTDVLVTNGEISKIAPNIEVSQGKVCDGEGALLIPGLVDLKAHVGAGRHDARETVESALAAASAGGFTHVVSGPDIDPPMTTEDTLIALLSRVGRKSPVLVHPSASLIKESGSSQLTEMAYLKQAGAVAFSTISPMNDGAFLGRALQYAHMLNVPLFIWAEDKDLAARGAVNESFLSQKLGLHGKHRIAESIGTAKALLVLEAFGGRLHLQRISTERSTEMISEAKKRGLAVTAECNYLNLILTEEINSEYDASTKVDPPLRGEDDRIGLIKAVRSGVIDCIVTDHTPLTREENDVEYDAAPVGAAGLETALPAIYTELILPGELDWSELITAMSVNPRRVIGIEQSHIQPGHPADFTIFDPSVSWTVDTAVWQSKGTNSPFQGKELTGRVRGIMRGETFVDSAFFR